jgi:hypothetical protein
MVPNHDEATQMLPRDIGNGNDDDNDDTANKQLEVKALACSIIENQMAQMTPIRNNRDRQRLANLEDRQR